MISNQIMERISYMTPDQKDIYSSEEAIQAASVQQKTISKRKGKMNKKSSYRQHRQTVILMKRKK
jgi:hypothetical protein